LRLLFFQFFLKFRCEHVFVPSHYYKIFAQKKYKVNSEKIKILPLGIDLDRFAGSKQDTKKSFSSKKIQIGCVASLRRVKRIDRLIRAIGYLDTDDRNNLSVWIVGDGAEKEHLQGLTTDLGLDKHIDFIPERKNLSPYYSKMDLFILPSKSESFSLVLLEAMYFSIPIIVFKGSGGAEELVNKTGCGIVVEDEKKLARICSKLIHNPDLLQTLCEKSSEIVKQSYTIKAVVKNFLNQLDVK
jgi:glycosyltransferase involved in cell wall biosynthesis